MLRPVVSAVAFALSLAVFAGCGPGDPTVPVKGEVTLDGQPLAEGAIQFIPVDQQSQTAGGTIQAGRFEFRSPPGKMKVEITAPKVVGKRKAYDTPDSPMVDVVKELLPAKYNVNSELTVDVERNKERYDFPLKSK